jgi:MoaA/NifB/PqqE/SkfB family radical SAM enzyme
MRIHTMVVTSAVIPIPREWMDIPRVRVTVSVDGLPEHHDIRRKPATYERILQNIAGCRVNIHGTITRPMLERAGYIDEYISFWSARPEVVRIWVSLYTPQQGERSAEMLDPAQRAKVAAELVKRERHPKLLMNRGIATAICSPPADPHSCMFAKMSTNYSADLQTRVEPCIFGGTRLPPVWLCDQQWASLAENTSVQWSQDRTHRPGCGRHRIPRGTAAQRLSRASTLDE